MHCHSNTWKGIFDKSSSLRIELCLWILTVDAITLEQSLICTQDSHNKVYTNYSDLSGFHLENLTGAIQDLEKIFGGHRFAACDLLGGLGACPPQNFENLHPQSDSGVLLHSIKHENKCHPNFQGGQDSGRGGIAWSDPSPTDLLKWPVSCRCTRKQAPSSEDGLHADEYGTWKHSTEDHDQHPVHNQLQKVKSFPSQSN